MDPTYSAELAKIAEPPEMADKPIQTRKPAASSIANLGHIMIALGSPEKATHAQLQSAISAMLKIAKVETVGDNDGHTMLYGAVAELACIDGVEPQTVINYATNAMPDDDALALRARMYLRSGRLGNALDDLEIIMADGYGSSLIGGAAEPQKKSLRCGWGIADFDDLGKDPRALAAKGFYLRSFLPFNARAKGVVKEAEIRDLYVRSSKKWRSPVPHYLLGTLDGLGSEQSSAGAGCIRLGLVELPASVQSACAKYDDGMRQQIRELTMALTIDPVFAPALAARANKHLTLAQTQYADGKPSRRYFELSINDFTAALAAAGKDKEALYCDRALAQASLGMYSDAAHGYEEGMKYAEIKNGKERNPSVYIQLAGIYSKMGRFDEAANIISQAIMNVSGGGLDVVVFSGDMKAFRVLYPEYDLLPDEILSEVIRRRYFPVAPKTWNDDFISGSKRSKGKVMSTILPELYIRRGDAYMKAGHRNEALADYRRVKSEAWGWEERLAPRHTYFDEDGARNYDAPDPFPPSPPEL